MSEKRSGTDPVVTAVVEPTKMGRASGYLAKLQQGETGLSGLSTVP
jgi:hypothetical protein